ncbi:MAG: hypothetical protein COA38_08660 [Fluviicola sp.]|nr:MAG: hypothetical protein COA38_08660 [Fluviicola sp.]
MKALLIGICLCVLGTAWSQSTWYEISTPTSNKLRAIDFVNSSVGYIVGDSTTILKTTDGGETWIELNHSGLSTNTWSQDLVDVDFVNELVGFTTLLNDNQGVYKTVDGGMTWAPAWTSGSNMCYKSCTYVTTENDYFVGGSGCFQSAQIEHFENSIWNVSTVNFEASDPGQYTVEMDFQNNIGLAVMKNQYMLRSTDSGATWDTLPALLTPGKTFTSIMFSSVDTVFAGYEETPVLPGFGFLMSVDGGLTWTNQSTLGFFYPAARDFTKASNYDLYAGGVTVNDMGIIFESTDGTIWTETLVLKPINGMDNYGDDVTFAVGDSGLVLSNVPPASIGLDEDDLFIPATIYPNPTVDIITIEIESKEAIVYNLITAQGQVAIGNIVVNNEKAIDLSEISAGVYYLKSTTELYPTVHKIIKL